MKLSPESVGSLAARFTDAHSEDLADKIAFEINRDVSDEAYDQIRDGLQGAVAELLGKLDL